jgi:hypothetical protein
MVLGLLVNEAAVSRTAADACPGLSPYTNRSHATEKGARQRCSLLENIERDGDIAPKELRENVVKELANRFAVEIEFSGEVGLPRRAVDYLLENMPETAVLVSAYSGKDYRATQTDTPQWPEQFFVTNNDTFAASFTYLYSRPTTGVSEHMFFESGFAKVFFWRVWGNSFIHYRLRPAGESSARYDFTVYVFTDSRLLRVVLESGPFRYFAHRMFKSILEDIQATVREFAIDPEPAEVLPPYYVSGLKMRLRPALAESTPRERWIRFQYRETQP